MATPVRPLVPVTVGDRLSQGVGFPTDGLRLRLESSQDPLSSVRGGYAFFGNVATDTDYVVQPQSFGVEVSLQLRSDRSPERFVLAMGLPSGAAMRRAVSKDPIPRDPPESIEVFGPDGTIAYVSPPVAFDADGVPVAARAKVVGDRIVITVDHRGRDLRYPLLVDPQVTSWGESGNNWDGWAWNQTL